MQLICLTRTKLGFQIPHDEEIKPLNGFPKAIFIAGPCAGVIDLSARISNRLLTRIHEMSQHSFIDPLEMFATQARRAAGVTLVEISPRCLKYQFCCLGCVCRIPDPSSRVNSTYVQPLYRVTQQLFGLCKGLCVSQRTQRLDRSFRWF